MRLSVELGVVLPIEVQEEHEVPSTVSQYRETQTFGWYETGWARIVLLSPGPGSLRMTLKIQAARLARKGRWE